MNLPFPLFSMQTDRTSQAVSDCPVQPETSVFQIDSVGCALSSIRSQCWEKEAHTKVEETSRIEKMYIKVVVRCKIGKIYFVSS